MSSTKFKCSNCNKPFTKKTAFIINPSPGVQMVRCPACGHELADGDRGQVIGVKKHNSRPKKSTAKDKKTNKIPRCSHILVISEDFKITDLGEYGFQNVRPMAGYPKDGLLIDSSLSKGKKYFVSTDDNIGIMSIMSRSNWYNDCVIFGSLSGEPTERPDGMIYKIKPYPGNTLERLDKEAKVKEMLKERDERDAKNQSQKESKTEPERRNPIAERMKLVKL